MRARRGAPWRASRQREPGGHTCAEHEGATGAPGQPVQGEQTLHLVELIGDGHDVATGDEQAHGGVGVAVPAAGEDHRVGVYLGGIAVVGDGARDQGGHHPVDHGGIAVEAGDQFDVVGGGELAGGPGPHGATADDGQLHRDRPSSLTATVGR